MAVSFDPEWLGGVTGPAMPDVFAGIGDDLLAAPLGEGLVDPPGAGGAPLPDATEGEPATGSLHAASADDLSIYDIADGLEAAAPAEAVAGNGGTGDTGPTGPELDMDAALDAVARLRADFAATVAELTAVIAECQDDIAAAASDGPSGYDPSAIAEAVAAIADAVSRLEAATAEFTAAVDEIMAAVANAPEDGAAVADPGDGAGDGGLPDADAAADEGVPSATPAGEDAIGAYFAGLSGGGKDVATLLADLGSREPGGAPSAEAGATDPVLSQFMIGGDAAAGVDPLQAADDSDPDGFI